MCPVCGETLTFDGEQNNDRFINGSFNCRSGHLFQVKEEIGLLKDAKFSSKEFEWKVNVADEKRYDETRRRYDSYLNEDQRIAQRSSVNKLVGYVIEASGKDGIVVDVASGMGTFLLPLAKDFSGLIIGTDVDEKPLRGAQTKAQRENVYHDVSLIVMDAKRMCFKDDSLSTVSSYFGFDNVPQTSLALRETARVLKRGGRVVLCSLWYADGSRSMLIADEHGVGEIASESRLRKTLDRAGLAVDDVEVLHSGVWPYNPMDLLPVEGETYSHVVIHASKH
jgi:SAM-dependent methyltransferase